jgi:hypothetical protein
MWLLELKSLNPGKTPPPLFIKLAPLEPWLSRNPISQPKSNPWSKGLLGTTLSKEDKDGF